MAREIDQTMTEIEATMDDLDETIDGVDEAMDGLWAEFELLKRDLKWGLVLMVVTVTAVITTVILLL